MDFLVQKKQGRGVVTSLTEMLRKDSPLIVIQLGQPLGDGFDSHVEQAIRASQGRPVSVLIDLSAVDPEPYMEPLLDIITNRRVCGTTLPDKSSIIIAMKEVDQSLGRIIPMPLANRTLGVDLTKPGQQMDTALQEMVGMILENQGHAVQENKRSGSVGLDGPK